MDEISIKLFGKEMEKSRVTLIHDKKPADEICPTCGKNIHLAFVLARRDCRRTARCQNCQDVYPV